MTADDCFGEDYIIDNQPVEAVAKTHKIMMMLMCRVMFGCSSENANVKILIFLEIELIPNTLLILLGCIMMHRLNNNINSPAAPPQCQGHFEPQNKVLPRSGRIYPLLRQPVANSVG